MLKHVLAVAGVIRALMSYYGVRGPFASFMFTFLRLSIDQTLENWTGMSASNPESCD
jgi:hypothetical protein